MHRSAAQAFYLAVFALFSGGCTVQAASPASSHTSPDVCALEPEAKVSDACASYADLDSLNNRLYPYIRNLANNTDFFSYYRLNLYDKECPFWSDENGLCGNIACAVTTLENETQIPQIWRAEKLSALEGPKAQHPGRKQQRERQRPLLDQLGTGVGESCVVEYDDDVNVPGLSAPFPALSENQAQAAMDFKHVMKAAIKSGVAEEALDSEEACLEKRVFYRVISGMHASISTHLCHDYLNQTTGQWGPNLQCYKERLHDHPERLSNLYFNYALVLRAVGKLRDYVQDYTFCTGDPEQDQLTKDMIKKLAGAIPAGPQIFDESVMFTDQTADGISLKEDFRNRFRNVSRIMDCVGCDKCRLWGKIQTNGFGTALKVLFEFGNGHVGDQKPLLRRTELVALINTLDKISAAMKALETFRNMIVAERDGTEPVEQAKLPQASSAEMAASLDDFDDIADGEADQGVGNEQSLTDVFREEFGLIFRAWVYVLKSWVGAPKKLGTIALMELSRLWDYWLGKPMRPRSWEFKGPDFREL
ncbi:endoplasmic oxidoreductin-1 [Friedmanniomyces endolithicus]|nr:endoplasmic oxidoreductin-1 [Friedmanniomyces endolithicus]